MQLYAYHSIQGVGQMRNSGSFIHMPSLFMPYRPSEKQADQWTAMSYAVSLFPVQRHQYSTTTYDI